MSCMNSPIRLLAAIFITLTSSLFAVAQADLAGATEAMEDSRNPLVLLDTSAGDIYLELFPGEAPNNVANFLALAAGAVAIIDPDTGTEFKPRYYDGMHFHRVIPEFTIQAGSPQHNPLGAPEQPLRDEINADALGLDAEAVLNPDGSFNDLLNLGGRADFEQLILAPLYQRMNIDSASELADRQYEVLEALGAMTVKAVYENLGYSYQSNGPSRRITRGIVALANSGPDSNGPEFFISLGDSTWLSGRYTVIGRVIEGMDVVDEIGETAIDPLRPSRRSTVIYSVRQMN